MSEECEVSPPTRAIQTVLWLVLGTLVYSVVLSVFVAVLGIATLLLLAPFPAVAVLFYGFLFIVLPYAVGYGAFRWLTALGAPRAVWLVPLFGAAFGLLSWLPTVLRGGSDAWYLLVQFGLWAVFGTQGARIALRTTGTDPREPRAERDHPADSTPNG